jgi:hypothetical protein
MVLRPQHLILAALFSCAPPLKLPDGVQCQSTAWPGMQNSDVANALSHSSAGDCVGLGQGTVQGALTVPSGVILAAVAGEAVKVTGTDAATPAITLSQGATLSGVTVESAAGVGILIDKNATLSSVTVDGAKGVGLVAWCEEDCNIDPITSKLDDVTLTGNAVGLWVRDAHVQMTGGRVADSAGTALGTGYGVVASDGAVLGMTSTVVESNQDVGLLIDGALGTSAALSQVALNDNKSRGIWAQGLLGSAASPKLTLDTCTLERNAIGGLGARASTGIQVTGGKIATTKLAPAQTSTPGVFVMVGDGLGLFESTGQVQMSGTTLEANERTQALIDDGAAGVSLSNVTVTPSSGQQPVVVQHTTVTVDAPSIVMPMAGMELPISSPTLAVPTR